MDNKSNYKEFRECVKTHPYLQFMKNYVKHDYNEVRELEARYYGWLLDRTDDNSMSLLNVVGLYSMANYCKLQYGNWLDADGFTYEESVEADVYGLFKGLHPTVRARVEKDFTRLQDYMKTQNPAMRRRNIFFPHP